MKNIQILALFISFFFLISNCNSQEINFNICDTSESKLLLRLDEPIKIIKQKQNSFFIHYRYDGEQERFSYIIYKVGNKIKDRILVIDHYLINEGCWSYKDSSNVNLNNFDTSTINLDTIVALLKEISEVKMVKGYSSSRFNKKHFEISWNNQLYKYSLCTAQFELYNKRKSYDMLVKWTNSIFHKCGDIRMCENCRSKKLKVNNTKSRIKRKK